MLRDNRDILIEHLMESLELQEDRAQAGLQGQTKVRRQWRCVCVCVVRARACLLGQEM